MASISLHLGLGVFDGLMAYWNTDHYYLHHAIEHLERFRKGSARMGMEIPWSAEEMYRGIEELLKHEPVSTHYVRPIAYRAEPELWVTGSQHRPVDVTIFGVRIEKREIGRLLNCHTSPVERVSSRAIPGQTKVCGAYVNSFHARRSAEALGFDDGLMIDRDGRLAEASAANVFAILADRLVTPPLNPDVFPGITRTVIFKLARECGIDVAEADLRPAQLAQISGAFLCSTLMEIRGIASLDQRELATRELPVYRELLAAFSRYTSQ